jgi:hypothetical protein
VLNGTLLSTVLTLSLLLVGIVLRPLTPRQFWTFVIVYTEAVIIVKYLFQVRMCVCMYVCMCVCVCSGDVCVCGAVRGLDAHRRHTAGCCQFPWGFNDLDCSEGAPSYQDAWYIVLGIQNYCGQFFSPYIVSELLILMSAFTQRTVLIEFGLWEPAATPTPAAAAAAAAVKAPVAADPAPTAEAAAMADQASVAALPAAPADDDEVCLRFPYETGAPSP